VLRNITFDAKPGETVAFIGSTGSGKSTLINLIPRFFDVTEGSITFGDTDIRNIRQKDLRERIGYIPQKGILFSGTIDSNLRYADDNASEELIETALEVSQAKEFVDRMPDRLNEPIAQGGTNVSGGQKQRLSIARALVKNAQVYIFDDSFSALDYATDARLREALNKLVEKTRSTVLIVAQRISTIRNADKIIVLDNGEITGIGTHDELMKTCKVYQEIAYSQLSEEELA
jgi:ATP-binding cassette subfamily B protein